MYQPSEYSQLSQEWRASVTEALKETADKHAQAAVIMERVTQQLNEHDNAIKALQGQPEKKHAAFIGNTGISLNVVYLLISLTMLLITLSSRMSISFH